MARIKDRSVRDSVQKQLRSDKDLNLQVRVLIDKQFKTAHQKLLSDAAGGNPSYQSFYVFTV